MTLGLHLNNCYPNEKAISHFPLYSFPFLFSWVVLFFIGFPCFVAPNIGILSALTAPKPSLDLDDLKATIADYFQLLSTQLCTREDAITERLEQRCDSLATVIAAIQTQIDIKAKTTPPPPILPDPSHSTPNKPLSPTKQPELFSQN